MREEEDGGGGEGDRGASPEPASPPGLGKFEAWLSMAAAFMSVIVAMAAGGPDRDQTVRQSGLQSFQSTCVAVSQTH